VLAERAESEERRVENRKMHDARLLAAGARLVNDGMKVGASARLGTLHFVRTAVGEACPLPLQNRPTLAPRLLSTVPAERQVRQTKSGLQNLSTRVMRKIRSQCHYQTTPKQNRDSLACPHSHMPITLRHAASLPHGQPAASG